MFYFYYPYLLILEYRIIDYRLMCLGVHLLAWQLARFLKKVADPCSKAYMMFITIILSAYGCDVGSNMLTQPLPVRMIITVSMASPRFTPHLFSAFSQPK